MLPDDPARAAALGRVALGDQVTPAFMRLLVVLRGVDVARADALFAAAVSVQARTLSPRIADVQMLGSYIGANGDAQLAGASVDTVRAFLESAFRALLQAPIDSSDATAAYFLGRQLFPAYTRYLPERLAELDARITLLSRSTGFQAVAVPAANRSAESADAVHARAASAAIDRDDLTTVHAEAAAIEDDDLRSRVYAQSALYLIKLRRLGEAAREAARVPDRARRATLLVQLARAAYSSGDVAYAVQTLGEAEDEAARSDTPAARLQALFSVTSAFVEVDPMRAFDSMKGAVESVNRASRAVGPAAPVNPASLNFDATLARLARLDFDRALLLADLLDARGHRLLAEISVCRGGLAAAGVEAAVEELDDEEPVAAL
jgi:hypothetical protein